MKFYDFIIIGGGAAGIAAAQKLVDLFPNKQIALFERDASLGGILQQCLHTGFGLEYFKQEYSGPEYADKIISHKNLNEIDIFLNTSVTEILSTKHIICSSKVEKDKKYSFDRLILATGSREIPFGRLGIPSSRPAGIFGAGEAQYLVNRMGIIPGKEVVILGAGDIGLIMSRRLIFEGIEVKAIVELKETPGGVLRNVQTCVHDFNVPLLTSSTIVKVHGKNRVTGVTIAEVNEDFSPNFSQTSFYKCDTLLTSVGLVPEIDLCDNLNLENKQHGQINTDSFGKTSIPWLYVCGNASSIHPIVDKVSFEGEKVAQGILNE